MTSEQGNLPALKITHEIPNEEKYADRIRNKEADRNKITEEIRLVSENIRELKEKETASTL